MNNEQNNLIEEEFGINEEGRSHFKDISQWAKINAIVSFVSLGISIIVAVAGLRTAASGAAAGGNLFGVMITAAISLLLNITLLQAAENIKKGVAMSDQGFFSLGITKFATYFKIMGILLIIALSLGLLFILFAMLMGLGRTF